VTVYFPLVEFRILLFHAITVQSETLANVANAVGTAKKPVPFQQQVWNHDFPASHCA
jgi:hypothetical protein